MLKLAKLIKRKMIPKRRSIKVMVRRRQEKTA